MATTSFPPSPSRDPADGGGGCGGRDGDDDGTDLDNPYDRAVAWCRDAASSGHPMTSSPDRFRTELASASMRFGMPLESLHSLFRTMHVAHLKRSARSVRSRTMRHVRDYLNGTSILTLAERANHPPSMMARIVVENVASPPPLPSPPPPPSAPGRDNGSAGMSDGDVGSAGGNHREDHRGAARERSTKKFVTEALRHPEKTLGGASRSVLPEYRFSERKGSGAKVRDEEKDEGGEDYGLPRLSRLALEVREAVDADPMYGPRHDRERHSIGEEYELLLQETLQTMGIPFETEADLRIRGTARTPDVLLSCPVGVKVRRRGLPAPSCPKESEVCNATMPEQIKLIFEDDDEYEWKVVCWIDSKVRLSVHNLIVRRAMHSRVLSQPLGKALFGDVDTHHSSVIPQAEAYVHRFGPGLVLYWFGHAPLERLGDGRGDIVVAGRELPEMAMLPTGEMCGRGGRQLFCLP
ncbi:hypothetical protein ACHAWF_007299 [Thalassiosira exigua]